MKRRLLIICYVCLLTVDYSYAQSNALPERIVWNNEPIPISIPLGQERIIQFPEAIRYWLPDHLGQQLVALAANGVLYLQAHQSFDATRIQVQSLVTQQLYLLDVASNKSATSTAKIIVLEKALAVNEHPVHSDVTHSRRHWYERLTRYAAQQLYAPQRLLNGDADIVRTTVASTHLPKLLRDPRIAARVLASWRGGGLFVTAVELHNLTEQPLNVVWSNPAPSVIEPQTIYLASQLRGQWLTASVQHASLAPTDRAEAVTTLYLISDTPFFAREGHHG